MLVTTIQNSGASYVQAWEVTTGRQFGGKRYEEGATTGKLCSTSSRQDAIRKKTLRHDIASIAFSPDGALFATMNKTEEHLEFREMRGSSYVATFPVHEKEKSRILVHRVDFSPDGQHLATATDKETRIWLLWSPWLRHPDKGR